MNFDFSEDVNAMREEVRRVLNATVPAGAVRALAERGEAMDRDLWNEAGQLGWLGISLPDAFGGAGLDYEPLCMIAEEVGRAAAPIPFSSSIYLVAEAIALFGSDEQKATWLPRLASGEAIGAFALAEGQGSPAASAIAASVEAGCVSGTKLPVWDGAVADLFIVAARGAQGVGLYLVEASETVREPISTIEFGSSAVRLLLDNAAAEALPGAIAWGPIQKLLDRAAILFAFEAVGGASAVLAMAVDHAQQRFAFGRPIASFQAIKHMLADVYVAIELARSNAYYGAWALSHDAAELPLAAASARLAATEAYERASAQAIQVHGGMGFTQEVDCHIHYRRAKRLAGEIGARRFWTDRLVASLPVAS